MSGGHRMPMMARFSTAALAALVVGALFALIRGLLQPVPPAVALLAPLVWGAATSVMVDSLWPGAPLTEEEAADDIGLGGVAVAIVVCAVGGAALGWLLFRHAGANPVAGIAAGLPEGVMVAGVIRVALRPHKPASSLLRSFNVGLAIVGLLVFEVLVYRPAGAGWSETRLQVDLRSHAPRLYEGVVAEARGPEAPDRGEPCRLSFEFEDVREGLTWEIHCIVDVRCGDRALYDGDHVLDCRLDPSAPHSLSMVDAWPPEEDGDPALDFRSSSGRLELTGASGLEVVLDLRPVPAP